MTGAEVRLHEHQHERQADQYQSGPDRIPCPYLAHRQLRIKTRDGKDDDRFHEFGWLQLHEAEVDPSLAAPRHAAHQFHDE